MACSDGLYEVRDARAIPVIVRTDGTFRSSVLLRSRVDPTRLWVGFFNGLGSLRWVNERWVDEGLIAGVTDEVRTLAEEDDGTLWVGTTATGVLNVKPAVTPSPGTPRPGLAVRRFGESDGLSPGGAAVLRVGPDLFANPGVAPLENRITRYDAATGRFVKDEILSALPYNKLYTGYGLVQAPGGRLLANYGRGTFVLTRDGAGGWVVDRSLFGRFGILATASAHVEDDNVAWLDWNNNVVRFDLTRAALESPPFTTLIRRVTAGHGRSLFGGGEAPGAAPRLSAGTDALRFEFSAPTYFDEAATEYQTRLDGLETEWSDWTRESRRDFTNLPFGRYAFRVRARSVIGQESQEARYAFTILAPWYRTWWAYAGYALLAGLAFYGSNRLARRRAVGQGARAGAVRRGTPARRGGRATGSDRERGQEAGRVAQRDRSRDHVLARHRHHLRQALRAREPARGCRRVRRRPL